MYFHNHAVQSQNHMWLGWLGFKCWSAHGCCCRSPPSGRSWWSPEEKVTKLFEKQRLNLWLSSAEDLESQPRSQRNVDPHGSHLDDLPSREVERVLAPDRHLRHLVPPSPPPPEVVEEEDKNKLLLAPPLIFWHFEVVRNALQWVVWKRLFYSQRWPASRHLLRRWQQPRRGRPGWPPCAGCRSSLVSRCLDTSSQFGGQMDTELISFWIFWFFSMPPSVFVTLHKAYFWPDWFHICMHALGLGDIGFLSHFYTGICILGPSKPNDPYPTPFQPFQM